VPLVGAEAISELIEAHRNSGAAATMASTMLEDPSGYGRVVRDAHGGVQRVVETKLDGDSTPSEREIREVNTGIFVFEPEIFDFIEGGRPVDFSEEVFPAVLEEELLATVRKG